MPGFLRAEVRALVHTAQTFDAAPVHAAVSFTIGADRPAKERILDVERIVRAASLDQRKVSLGEGFPVVRHQCHGPDAHAEQIRMGSQPKTHLPEQEAYQYY